jgi:hypothetical protein
MKRSATMIAALLAMGVMTFGCATFHHGPASGHVLEFRQQLESSSPVKEYGCTIKDLRFTNDYRKALVVFAPPDGTSRPEWEFVLFLDEFGRYVGAASQALDLTGGANFAQIRLTVVVPKK